MKGGFGCAIESAGEWHVGAMAVVNALGDVRDGSGRIIAGARAEDDTPKARRFVDASRQLASASAALPRLGGRVAAAAPANTTLCVIATDAPLGRVELTQLARAAGAALFRRITPTGTSVDGDIVFAVAPAGPPKALGTATMSLEALAVAALEGAIERAVRTARGREGVLGLAD